MIAVDTNILIYSHRPENPFHTNAKNVINTLRDGPGDWAIPWPCVHEFISTVTNSRIFKNPTPLPTAFLTIEIWGKGGNIHFLSESSDYFEKLKEISINAKISGPRVHDARIAALCLHHGIRELWTADRDFTSFPKLKIKNPLVMQ